MLEWLSVYPVTVRAFNGSSVTIQVGTAVYDGSAVQAAMRVGGSDLPVWLPSSRLRELVANLRQAGREVGEDI